MERNSFIEKYFTDIKVDSEYLELYSVRTALFKAVKQILPLFYGRILDIGCGIMPYREIIKKNIKVSEYIGMDLKNAAYHNMMDPDLEWDGYNIPLDDNSTDCELATEFLEHYHDTQSILQEMIRVLKPGGLLFGTVPFVWNLHEIPYDEYRFTPYSLQKHLTKAGYIGIKIHPLGGANAALAQMLGLWYATKNFKKKPIAKHLLIWIYKWLLKYDKVPTSFDGRQNSLFNGLYFIANKP